MKIIWRACSVLKTWRNSMAKAGRLPDFRKMYPEASEEIISVLKETERKMQYQEYDLKAEQAVLDRKTGRVSILPGREDSLDRMMEAGLFPDRGEQDIEAEICSRLQYEKLHRVNITVRQSRQSGVARKTGTIPDYPAVFLRTQ